MTISILDEKTISVLEGACNLQMLEQMANEIVIRDEESARQGLAMALQSRKLKNQTIASKQEILRPNLDFQKAVNKMAGDLKTRYEAIEKRLESEVVEWIRKENENPFHQIDSLQVEDGTLAIKKVWSFEIVDEQAVPAEFRIIDETAIDIAVQKGMRKIPGVKIFEKEEITMRVKN